LEIRLLLQLVELGLIQEEQRLGEIVARERRERVRRRGSRRAVVLGARRTGAHLQLQLPAVDRPDRLAARLRQRELLREQVHVPLLERDEVLPPEPRDQVVAAQRLQLPRALDHGEELLDLVLEPRQERQVADAILVELDRETLAALAHREAVVAPAE